MKFTTLIVLLSMVTFGNKYDQGESTVLGQFDIENDLLLAHFDCKTDVDDLHTVAALATLLQKPKFSDVKMYAVAGAYGTQKGLYVPPNDLFQIAFGDKWSDAHNNFSKARDEVKVLAKKTLDEGGDLWISDAGQSDFSAALVKTLKKELPNLKTRERIHIVQHSEWNEKVTSQDQLQYVKENTDYHKIPDGNAVGNGTPGFRSEDPINWEASVSNMRLTKIWNQAIELGNKYNGQEGRYLNEAIAAGGLDFSDLSETCWIFGLEEIKDANAFFKFVKD